MRTRAVVLAGILAAGGADRAAGQAPDGGASPYRSGVQAVTVEVGVTDDNGAPVTDLAAGDFTVTVGGKPRRVVSASYVDAGTPALARASERRLPISSNDGLRGGRLVVFVVDQNTLAQSEVRQAVAGAARFLERLTPADRSAAVLMPVGEGVPFTSDHARVQRALMRATGFGMIAADPSGLGLEEVRAIASGDYMALQTAASRECPGQGDGGPSPGGTGGGQPPGGGGGQQPGGGAPPRGLPMPGGFGSTDSCTRRIQFEATSVWQQAHATALSSLTALRGVFASLERLGGDKTVILISGGWPMHLKEAASDLRPVAEAAANAHATVFSLYGASMEASVERRTVAKNPLADESVRRWPLQTLSGMTGGGSYRVDAAAGPVFDRLARELSGFYRIGIEQEPSDADRRPRAMKVDVARRGARVRSRERFLATSYAERDMAARLDEALTAPLPSTGLGVRVASYVTPDAEAAAKLKVLLVGDAFGLQPGPASFQLMLQDASGEVVGSATQPLGDAGGERVPFLTSISVVPGRYVVRLAVADAAGSVGSVDHVIEARHAALGALTAGDLLLARVPAPGGEAQYVLDGVSRDDRLAMQLELAGDHVADADVLFEIASADDGPALVRSEATLLSGRGTSTAQAVTDLRILPPGLYVARARVRAGGTADGLVTRPFIVSEGAARTTSATGGAGNDGDRVAGVAPVRLEVKPAFASGQVLALPVLGGFLDRLAARSDAASPAAASVIAQLRDTPPAEVGLPEGLAADSPVVASFATGLAQFARGELDPAAQSFRAALRASEDFYPAMVYIGACFAAGGKDREAAGAWQTALIKAGDVPAVHLLLVDALLRLGRHDAALGAAERARARWPGDPAIARRYAIAAIAAGKAGEALDAIDGLPGTEDDEPALMLGLQALYEGVTSGQPIHSPERDRDRLVRYAATYKAIGGPSLALVEAWVASVTKGP